MSEGKKASKTDQTFIMVKPDGVSRGLVPEIMSRFQKKGFKLVAAKLEKPSQEKLETHYEDLKSKKFFPGLIKYMTSGPVFAMVWEGLNAPYGGRKLLGATNPADSAPGTIRGDLCIDIGRNICHGSDSHESAAKEIKLWFPEGVISHTDVNAAMIYE
uniref:nucleoside-diphosphate kinase n=1 Tax=Bigelowiella natans TaxID=227086 RepID=A0A6U1GWY0_BIGNA|eukprot:jgi/Bigna1/49587/estExt_Genewise1.C_520030